MENQLITSTYKTFEDCKKILVAKNADYAGDTNPYKNFENAETVGVSIERGIMVRIMDKVARISNGLDKDYKVKDETIFDSLIDLINYSAILKAYIESKECNGKRT